MKYNLQGDEQVFTLIWHLIKNLENKEKFHQIIPSAADWHWNWHLLQGIFKFCGKFLLLPLSQVIGYSNLDLKCAKFHVAEVFFQLVTWALEKWVVGAMENLKVKTATELLQNLKKNILAYETLYLYIYDICLYWIARAAIKIGDSETVTDFWRYFIHLFIATGKFKYIMFFRFLWVLFLATQALNPNIATMRFFSPHDPQAIFYFILKKLYYCLLVVK